MANLETTDTILNPSRQPVKNLVGQALEDSAGDPSQVFADLIMATAVIASMAEIEIGNVKQMFELAMPNARTAADYILTNLEG